MGLVRVTSPPPEAFVLSTYSFHSSAESLLFHHRLHIDRNEQPFYFRAFAKTVTVSPEMEFIFPLSVTNVALFDLWIRFRGEEPHRPGKNRGTKGTSSVAGPSRKNGPDIPGHVSDTRYLLLGHVFDSGHCGHGFDISRVKRTAACT